MVKISPEFNLSHCGVVLSSCGHPQAELRDVALALEVSALEVPARGRCGGAALTPLDFLIQILSNTWVCGTTSVFIALLQASELKGTQLVYIAGARLCLKAHFVVPPEVEILRLAKWIQLCLEDNCTSKNLAPGTTG